MVRRRLLVHVLLGALLACALAGALAVFMPTATGAGRLAGSAGVVVVACALLLPLSRPTESSRPAMAGMAWLALVVGAVALALVNIWELARSGGARDVAGTLLLAWCGYGLPVAVVLLTALRRAASVSGVRHPAAVACAVLGATAAFVGAVGMEVHDALASASTRNWGFVPAVFLATVGASVTGAANLMAFRRPALTGRGASLVRRVGAAGFACTLVALALIWTLLKLSFDPRGNSIALSPPVDGIQPYCFAISGAAIAAGIWGPVSSLGFRGWAAWLAPGAAAITLAIATLLTIASLDRWAFYSSSNLLMRSTMALGIIDASALLTVALLMRYRRSDTGNEDFLRPVTGLDLKCPRCATPRHAALGESACHACGLVLLLAVRDDRCPGCGYDLRHAQAGSCPECGRARQTPVT